MYVHEHTGTLKGKDDAFGRNEAFFLNYKYVKTIKATKLPNQEKWETVCERERERERESKRKIIQDTVLFHLQHSICIIMYIELN